MSEALFYSPAEIAKVLGCSRKQIYRKIASGELLALAIGPRSLRVPRDELDRWLELQTAQAKSAQQTRSRSGWQQ
jgi:excisionase family DNA binding protein